jgi:hypothetical protein
VQVAFFAGLQAHFVEIGVAQAAEQARRRSLGDLGHGRQLGGGKGQHVVGAVQQQGGQLALAGGELVKALLDGQRQAGGHGCAPPGACCADKRDTERMRHYETRISCYDEMLKQWFQLNRPPIPASREGSPIAQRQFCP